MSQTGQRSWETPSPLGGEGWGEGAAGWVSSPSPGTLKRADLSPAGRGEGARQ